MAGAQHGRYYGKALCMQYTSLSIMSAQVMRALLCAADDVRLAEETVCIREQVELSQQQQPGPECKTTRRFQVHVSSGLVSLYTVDAYLCMSTTVMFLHTD